MYSLYQLRAFVAWMLRKTLRLPLSAASKTNELLQAMVITLHKDRGEGFFVLLMFSLLVFMGGFVCGIAYEFLVQGISSDAEGRDAVITAIKTGGVFTIAFVTVVFFNTCWYAFTQEQAELLNRLKEKHNV